MKTYESGDTVRLRKHWYKLALENALTPYGPLGLEDKGRGVVIGYEDFNRLQFVHFEVIGVSSNGRLHVKSLRGLKIWGGYTDVFLSPLVVKRVKA